MEVQDITQELGSMRVIDMTASQLAAFLSSALGGGSAAGAEPVTAPAPTYVYGITGLARLLGCSDATAWRYKKSGRFDEAISQTGKTIVIDVKKVMEITSKRNRKK